MTKDDIIAMAREAGWDAHHAEFDTRIERFATLVAAAEQKKWFDQTEVEINEAVLDEREACAKVCDDIDAEYEGDDVLATWCSRAIRARSNT